MFYVGALLISKQKTDLNAVLIVSTLLLFSLSSANALIGLSKPLPLPLQLNKEMLIG